MKSRRAFTIIELTLVILVCIVIAALLLMNMGGRGRGNRRTGSTMCASQVRTIVQACFTFATSNKGQYPLPSLLDIAGQTLPSETPGVPDTRKDTTGNILAILIQGGGIAPETCVSPAEASGSIRIDEGYEATEPTGTVNPAKALWDPKFAGTPQQGGNAQSLAPRIAGIGNNSYAHCPAFGGKRSRWSSTSNTTEAVWGNRGPGYQGTTAPIPTAPSSTPWKLNAAGQTPPGVDSVTLAIHGARDTWEGNIGYNDAHVEFETRPDPVVITYKRVKAPPGQKSLSAFDNLFVDETDDVTRNGDTNPDSLVGTNQFLAMISRVNPGASAEAAPTLTLYKD